MRLDFERHAAGFSRAMAHLDHAATKELDRVGFDPKLRELVRLRNAQLVGCAYCLDMHSKDARAIGETEQRLYGLAAFGDAPFYSEREKAALAFTDAMTRGQVTDGAYAAAAEHFSEDEMGALVSLIATINAWTHLSVTTLAWEPGSYEA